MRRSLGRREAVLARPLGPPGPGGLPTKTKTKNLMSKTEIVLSVSYGIPKEILRIPEAFLTDFLRNS